ncbi:MAG TPA: HNH endonuclease, partial [Anaeromyxobacteraceae bacterium]|nr:HNH endonuclease [Anaeromyxobacteraceae bacterium]
MGPPPELAAVVEAWMKMVAAPPRPTAGAWQAEREPSLRGLERQGFGIEVNESDRRGLVRHEAALLVDRLLAPVARGRGALDLAIGEALGVLSLGDRALRLGYASIGDYAREKLGLKPRTAQAMAQLSRELRRAPLLQDAVLRGEVSASKAQAVLPVVFGDNESAWVERARAETVRALERAVRTERGEEEAEESWDRIYVPLSAAERAVADEALLLAGKVLGTLPPR